MEYPPLVAGHTALFAVHLTTLADFKPVTAGQARVEFTPEGGGQATALVGPQPSRPGAFRVEGAPPAAGRYRWALVLNAPELSDRHDLGAVQIFADEQTANADDASRRPADDAAAIAYLKEQQWTNEFATTAVQDADVRTSMRVPAVLASACPAAKRSSRRRCRPLCRRAPAIDWRPGACRGRACASRAETECRRRPRDARRRGRGGASVGRSRPRGADARRAVAGRTRRSRSPRRRRQARDGAWRRPA